MTRTTKGRRQTLKQRPSTMEQGRDYLRAYAVGLYDTGDGRAAEWPVLAQALFAAAFSVLDEARGDERHAKLLRRVEVSLYHRLAGTAEEDTLKPALDTGPGPATDPLRPHRTPEPRNRP